MRKCLSILLRVIDFIEYLLQDGSVCLIEVLKNIMTNNGLFVNNFGKLLTDWQRSITDLWRMISFDQFFIGVQNRIRVLFLTGLAGHLAVLLSCCNDLQFQYPRDSFCFVFVKSWLWSFTADVLSHFWSHFWSGYQNFLLRIFQTVLSLFWNPDQRVVKTMGGQYLVLTAYECYECSWAVLKS